MTTQTPERNLSSFAAVLIGAGQIPSSVQTPVTAPVPTPTIGNNMQYGAYMATVCKVCHGADFAGGTPSQNGPPAGPNLVSIFVNRTEAQFIIEIRTGVTPDGKQLKPDLMPWPEFNAALNDEELKAIFNYIKTYKP